MLLDTHRPADAATEARAGLGAEPENRDLLHLLCMALIKQQKLDEARAVAANLTRLAPEWADAHMITCVLEMEAKRFKAAERAAKEARRLAPFSAVPRFNLASCYLAQQFWHSALVEAEAGLALDPQNAGCARARSLALLQTGHEAESVDAAKGALHHNPEDSHSQLVAGWATLGAGDYQDAVGHFTEALRLDPTDESAKAGLVEALKNRNWFYRSLLAFALLLSRHSRDMLWILRVGVFVSLAVAKGAAGNIFSMLGLAIILTMFFLGLAGYAVTHLFNFLLMLDPKTRHALSEKQRTQATVAGTLAMLGGLGAVVTVVVYLNK